MLAVDLKNSIIFVLFFLAPWAASAAILYIYLATDAFYNFIEWLDKISGGKISQWEDDFNMI